jgi:hypothetical protein
MRKDLMVDVLVTLEKNGNYYIDFTYLEIDFRQRFYTKDLYFYK